MEKYYGEKDAMLFSNINVLYFSLIHMIPLIVMSKNIYDEHFLK